MDLGVALFNYYRRQALEERLSYNKRLLKMAEAAIEHWQDISEEERMANEAVVDQLKKTIEETERDLAEDD